MITSLREKLFQTRKAFLRKFAEIIQSNKNREEIFADLFEMLILADVGINTAEKILDNVRKKCNKEDSFSVIKSFLEEEIMKVLSQFSPELKSGAPQTVVMFVGVNGGGKTTSLAKFAYFIQSQGKSVMAVAADTFRAAAQEQLLFWGKRLNFPVIKGQYGADSASVVFDALQSLKARSIDFLLVDTAGRIHTNLNLMNELEKIKRVIAREIEGAPQEIFLILDCSTGQNALIQAREFLKFSGITGVFLTKLDGTAKGGSVIGIVEELKIPVKFIGIGEREKDLLPFSAEEFTRALLS